MRWPQIHTDETQIQKVGRAELPAFLTDVPMLSLTALVSVVRGNDHWQFVQSCGSVELLNYLVAFVLARSRKIQVVQAS